MSSRKIPYVNNMAMAAICVPPAGKPHLAIVPYAPEIWDEMLGDCAIGDYLPGSMARYVAVHTLHGIGAPNKHGYHGTYLIFRSNADGDMESLRMIDLEDPVILEEMEMDGASPEASAHILKTYVHYTALTITRQANEREAKQYAAF